MMNTSHRFSLLALAWCALTAAVGLWSVRQGAEVSTSLMLCLLCLAPPTIMLLLGFGVTGATVTDLIHSAKTRNHGHERTGH